MGYQVKIRTGLLTVLLTALAGCSSGTQAPAPTQAAVALPPALAAPSAAATVGSGGVEMPTPAEKYLMSQGVNIGQAFMSRSGLKAIVADNGTERRLFYVAPDGNSLISGMVFDLGGVNITQEDMARFNVRDVGGNQVLGQDQLGGLWERAGELEYIAEGTGRPVYVIFDPKCPYCHQLWRALREVASAGQVQVRWIPVGILSEPSKNLAAALYQSPDSLAALSALADGSLAGVQTIDKSVADSLARNVLLLRDTGYTGVPTLLWKEGDQVRVRMEVPEAQQFAKIFH